MRSIFDLTWGGTSFFSKVVLFWRSGRCEQLKMRSGSKTIQAEGYSALSSTYFSIAGTGRAQFRSLFKLRLMWLLPFHFVWFIFTWLPLSAWCYWKMLPLSNKVEELIGYGMTAEQCDIRQSILRKRGRLTEAMSAVTQGLGKQTDKMHTKGLLCVGMAAIHWRRGEMLECTEAVEQALHYAEKAEKTDPRQAARIYRYCAAMSDIFEEKYLMRKAEKLAKKTGTGDQLLKI